MIWNGKAGLWESAQGERKWREIVEKGKASPSVMKWMLEEEVPLKKLEAKPILMRLSLVLGHLKEQYKVILLATFKALLQEDNAAILTEMTGVGVE